MHRDRLEERAVHEQVVDALGVPALEVVVGELDGEGAFEARDLGEDRVRFGRGKHVLDDRVAVALDPGEVVGGVGHENLLQACDRPIELAAWSRCGLSRIENAVPRKGIIGCHDVAEV